MQIKIDKNSLWGELNIQKGELCVKGFLSQHLGVGWGLFQHGFGGIRVEKGGGDVFKNWGRLVGGFEAHRGTPVPSALDSPSLLTTEGKPPRGSRGPDEGGRRSWGVERKDPGRIWLALSRPGSEPVGHGPWESVLT